MAVAVLLWGIAAMIGNDARKETGRARWILCGIASGSFIAACSVWVLWNVVPSVSAFLAKIATFPPTWFFLLGLTYISSRSYFRPSSPVSAPLSDPTPQSAIGRSAYADRDLFNKLDDKVQWLINGVERAERETAEAIAQFESNLEAFKAEQENRWTQNGETLLARSQENQFYRNEMANALLRLRSTEDYHARFSPFYGVIPLISYLLTDICARIFMMANEYDPTDQSGIPQTPKTFITLADQLAMTATKLLEQCLIEVPPMPADFDTGGQKQVFQAWASAGYPFIRAVYIDNQLQEIWRKISSEMIEYKGQ